MMNTVQPLTGVHEIALAVDQPQYEALVIGAYYNNALGSPVFLSRWKPTDEERARIAAGEDLYLSVNTFGGPFPPVGLQVGPEGWVVGATYADISPIRPEEVPDA